MLQIQPEYVTDPEDGKVKATPPNPYITLVQNGALVHCQRGKYYDGGGDEISLDNVPNWFWALAKNCEAKKREAVGLILPEDRVVTPEEKEAANIKAGEEMWQCPECPEKMPANKKNWHIARHARTDPKKATTIVKEGKHESVKATTTMTESKHGKSKV